VLIFVTCAQAVLELKVYVAVTLENGKWEKRDRKTARGHPGDRISSHDRSLVP